MNTKLLFEKVLSKMLVREKTKHKWWRKISWNWPSSNSNYDLIKFGPIIFFTNYKSQHPEFSETVRILGAQMKKTPTKLPFEIVWSNT